MERKPNFVFFIPDQWRGDVLGHAGNPAAVTPNLDRLVETDAVSFSHAFCQNPVCVPSRCSFMTGWYPHVRGHRTMSFPLQPGEPCLLSELRQNGYEVWWGGKNDLVTDPEAFKACFDYRHEPEVTHEDRHGDTSWRATVNGRTDRSFLAGKLEKHPGEEIYRDKDWDRVLSAREYLRNRRDDRPFCLCLTLDYPHPPYAVEEPYFSAIDRSRLPARIKGDNLSGKSRVHGRLREALELQGRPESWWDGLRATYYGMCMRVDAQAGMILDTLKETGVYDDTAFILFSDHGDYAGDYDLVEKGQTLFEDCLTRVPFILKPPASHGRVSGRRSGLVELVDFPATVYDLAGIQPGYWHFGRSLLPLLERDGAHREAVFCSGGRLRGEDYGKEERGDPDGLYEPRHSVECEDDVAHGKSLMCRDRRFKLISRLYDSDEFYDLETDPGETTNRIADPAYAAERDRLYDLTRRFLLETTDVIPFQRYPRNCR